MKCEHCDTENAEGSRFCSNCGEPLAIRCASCGEIVPAGSKFCPSCGARLVAAESAPSAPAPTSQPFGAPPPPAAAPTYGPPAGAAYYAPTTPPYGPAAPYPSGMPTTPSAPPPPSYGGIASAPTMGASTVGWVGSPSAAIPPYAQPLPVYKGVWPRFFAMLLDGIILGVPLSILMMVVFRNQEAMAYGDTGAMMGPYMLMMLLSLAYSILLEANGGTLGKRILGMKIVDGQGNKPGLGKSIVRNLLRIVDSLPGFYLVGVIAVASSPTKQRIGDKVAGTFVVAK